MVSRTILIKVYLAVCLFLLISNLSLPLFSLIPFPLVLPQQTLLKSVPPSSLLPPFRYRKASIRSPQKQAFSVYTRTLLNLRFSSLKTLHLELAAPGTWARWPQENWFSMQLLPLSTGLGWCKACALLRQIRHQMGFDSWPGKEGLGKEWRHWAFPFPLLFLPELHLACLRHNPSCWGCNLPICVNLQVKKKDPSPAADGSPDSLGVTFHLDVHSVWDTGKGYASSLACTPPRFTVRRLLSLLISCSPFASGSSLSVKRW